MTYGVYLSAAGAHVQDHRMKALSHNLANVDTPGYKPQHSILQARFSELIEQGQVAPGIGGADDIGGGVTIQRAMTEFSQGTVRTTGRETDFAISDDSSFFVVLRGEEKFLTRAGDFAFDARGQLVTQAGETVLSSDGKPIQIQPGLPFEVTQGGRIRQAANQWDLMLGKPKHLGDLSRTGTNLFKPLADFDLVPANARKVVPRSLEMSAVSPTGAMMELIETSRAYEANVRLIQHQDSVMGSLISRVLQA
jgi:flagellar basal body rod protein FlgG